jgi:hypothetical protein
VRTEGFLPDGVGGKLNVFLAKNAGHLQVFGSLQSEGCLAKRAGNFPSKVLAVKVKGVNP